MTFDQAGQWGPHPVLSSSGQALPAATFEVFEEDGTTPATIFTDESKGTVESQPVNVDPLGNATFWAVPGRYVIKFTVGGASTSFDVPAWVDPSDVISRPEANAAYPTLISLKGWGAVGDGVTDDTAALQAAVNEHLATGLPIYVQEPPVRYRIVGTINVSYASSKATVFRMFGLNSGSGPYPRTLISYEGNGAIFDVQLDSWNFEGVEVSGISFEQPLGHANYQTGVAFQLNKVAGHNNYQRKIRFSNGTCRGLKSLVRFVGVDVGRTPVHPDNFFGPTYFDDFMTYLTLRPLDFYFATLNLLSVTRGFFHACDEGAIRMTDGGLFNLKLNDVLFQGCEPGGLVLNDYHTKIALDNVSSENTGDVSGWGLIAPGKGDIRYNTEVEFSNRMYPNVFQPAEYRLPRGCTVRSGTPILVAGDSVTIETPEMVTPVVSNDAAFNQADKYTLVRTPLRPGPTYAGSKVFTNLAGQHGTSKGTSPRSENLPAPIRATHVGSTRIIANAVDTFTAPSNGFVYITWIAKAVHATNNGFSAAKVTIAGVDVVIPLGFRWRPHTGVYTLMVPIASGQVLSNVELTQHNTDWRGPALVTFSAAAEPASVCANGFPRVLRRSEIVPASGTYTLTDKGQIGPGQPFAVRTRLLFNGGRTGVFECVTRGDGQNADRVRTDIVNSLTAAITVGAAAFPAHEDMVSLLLTNTTATAITVDIETVYQS